MGFRTVQFGTSRGSLLTCGYKLRDAAGTLGTRITVGVAEVVAGSGIYAADVDESADPVGILWDTGAGGATVYAAEDFVVAADIDAAAIATEVWADAPAGTPVEDIADAAAAAVWADAPAGTPLEDIAVAVRDVDNTSPAADSLGEAVNDGAGGGGGGSTPTEIWAHTSRSLTDKAGFALGATGLDAIPTTAPTGVASTYPQMTVQLFRRFFKKVTKTSSTIRTYADNGSTIITSQPVSDDDTTETQGAAT